MPVSYCSSLVCMISVIVSFIYSKCTQKSTQNLLESIHNTYTHHVSISMQIKATDYLFNFRLKRAFINLDTFLQIWVPQVCLTMKVKHIKLITHIIRVQILISLTSITAQFQLKDYLGKLLLFAFLRNIKYPIYTPMLS